MQVSAEIRWFLPRESTNELRTWFASTATHQLPLGEPEVRIDTYRIDQGQCGLGIKRRGDDSGGIDVKVRIPATQEWLAEDPFCGLMEVWGKIRLQGVILSGTTIRIKKQRRYRLFRLANTVPVETAPFEQQVAEPLSQVCIVEFTDITVDNNEWSTFAFASLGSLKLVIPNLGAVARLMAKRSPPQLTDASVSSYASWINGQRQERKLL